MIYLDGVSKSYRTENGYRVILDDVTTTLPTNKHIGVLGRNGTGKSTFLRMISGEERPDAGRIRRNARVSWPLGFTGGFHPALTGRENLLFISRVYDCDVEEVTAYVQNFSELYRPHSRTRNFSCVMTRKLSETVSRKFFHS